MVLPVIFKRIMEPIENNAHVQSGLEFLAEADPRLIPIIARAGEVELRLSTADFKGLASIIVSQQVSKASAAAIFGRLVVLVNPLTAENYMEAGEPAWIEAGLSRPKQRTMINICDAISLRQLDLSGLCAMPADEAIETMTRLKGIGPWTAEVFLLFCAGHPDIFPAGDLALQEALRVAFNLNARPSDKAAREMAKLWSPWRGVAARLFWAYYRELKGGRDAAPV